MKISIRLFATLTRFIAGVTAGQTIPYDLMRYACLRDLLEQLQLPHEEVGVCFVNGRVQEMDYQLNEGDEVGIFPPIGGG